MPFTLAHPIAVLPLFRKNGRWSETALVAGSISPDFEYFLQLRAIENLGHHWYGIIPFDIPVALLLAFVFHAFVKKVFIPHLPQVFQTGLGRIYHYSWTEAFWQRPFHMILCALLGVVSHLLMDGFTHHDGFMLSYLPGLAQPMLLGMPVYMFLQIFLSLLGSIWVLYYIFRLGDNTLPKLDKPIANLIPKYLIIFALIMVVRLLVFPKNNNANGLLMGFIGANVYTIFCIGFWHTQLQKRNI